jgi:hypothetical protein
MFSIKDLASNISRDWRLLEEQRRTTKEKADVGDSFDISRLRQAEQNFALASIEEESLGTK